MKTIATVAAAIVAAIAKTNRKFYRERQEYLNKLFRYSFFIQKTNMTVKFFC